eukprot:scaffold10168_cov187-Skeletonema_dohrnii-CCMP3373.AAC.1
MEGDDFVRIDIIGAIIEEAASSLSLLAIASRSPKGIHLRQTFRAVEDLIMRKQRDAEADDTTGEILC